MIRSAIGQASLLFLGVIITHGLVVSKVEIGKYGGQYKQELEAFKLPEEAKRTALLFEHRLKLLPCVGIEGHIVLPKRLAD